MTKKFIGGLKGTIISDQNLASSPISDPARMKKPEKLSNFSTVFFFTEAPYFPYSVQPNKP
jgi:hypothetical protein